MNDLKVFDGVAIVIRGDTFISVWKESATLTRVRWHGAMLENHVANLNGKALVVMIILPTAGPPQGEARVASSAVAKRVLPKLRLAVTAAVGSTVWLQVIRTVMRGILFLSGEGKHHQVVTTEAAALDRILEVATARTPNREALEALLRDLHAALEH